MLWASRRRRSRSCACRGRWGRTRVRSNRTWLDAATGLKIRALPGQVGDLPPAVLDRGTQVGRPGDGDLVLAGGVAKDFHHLGGPTGAGGDERGVRRMQPIPADGLGVGDAPRAEFVALVVGVPPQLHKSHLATRLTAGVAAAV